MFDLKTFDVQKFDTILARGLCKGVGNPNEQMCIEAAICNVLGLGHGDDPKCVARSVRKFKICLNDKNWSSPQARADGLRDLGLAQLGSLGIVNDKEFVTRLSTEIIRQLIPTLFREIFTKDSEQHKKCLEAANLCEKEPNRQSVLAAKNAAADADAAYATYTAANAYAAADAAYADDAAYAAYAAAAAADAAYADDAAYAAYAAAAAAAAEKTSFKDKYLILVAKIALQILKELCSPGCQLLDF